MPGTERLIVFDLDGTLVDTLPDIALHCNRLLAGEGYPVWDTEDYLGRVGWGLRETLRLSLPPEVSEAETERLMHRFAESYTAEPVIRTVLYPGMEKVLEKLSAKGWRMMVYTNKVEETARRILSLLLPGRRFDAVLGAVEGRPQKPDPSVLLEYLRSTELGKSAILYVGDSPVDAETARRAGVDFAGVLWGYRSARELAEAGSRVLLHAPEELPGFLEERFE